MRLGPCPTPPGQNPLFQLLLASYSLCGSQNQLSEPLHTCYKWSNPTLRPSTGHPQDFAVVKMRHSELLQASYTHCVGQTNLYRTPIRIAAVKTDSPNHYMATKRFVVTKSDCQELCMLATSFGVAKLNSANLYTHATSFAVVKRDSPSFYRPTKPFCGCQNGLFELLQGSDMLCSGKN